MNETLYNTTNSNESTVTSIYLLSAVIRSIHRSILIIYIVFGLIGNILNIFVFKRPALSRTSSSFYLLATSIANLLVTGFVIPLDLLADGFALDSTTISLLVCKLVSYIYYVFLALPPFFTVLACADRWAASCVQVNRRRFANIRIAKRIIPVIIIICVLLYSYILVTFTHNPNPPPPLCSAGQEYTIFTLTFYLIIYSLIPPFFMALFSISIILNIRQRRHRVTPVIQVINASTTGGAIGQARPRGRRNQMQVMLVCQAIIECIFTLSFSVVNVISTMVTNDEYFLAIHSLIHLLIFFNYVSSFYIYTLSSKLYRNEFKKLVRQTFGCC